jgi:hypothetical protein
MRNAIPLQDRSAAGIIIEPRRTAKDMNSV